MNSWIENYYHLNNRFNRLLGTYILNGIVQTCGHREWEDCGCLGMKYAGKSMLHAYKNEGWEVEDHT